MIARLFKPFARFYHWWVSALLSCLPEQLAHRLSRGGNMELVIAHQGDSIFVQTTRGKILDSISLVQDAEIDFDQLPAERTEVGGGSYNTFIDSHGELLGEDPPFADQDEIDILLNENRQEVDIELLDLTESMSGEDSTIQSCDIDLSASPSSRNVVPLNIRREDSTVRLVDEDDQTSRLIDLDMANEDDTIIIKKQQGKLLHFGTTQAPAPDHTVLFASVGGKIQQVESSDVGDNYSDPLADSSGLSDITRSGTAYSIVARLLDRHQGSRKTMYLMPERDLFLVRLSYPLEAMENIEGVVSFDLEKHIPVSVQSVRYFYALNVDQPQNRVDVDVAVMKSQDFDVMNQVLGRFSHRGLLCTTAKFYRKYGKQINFLEAESGSSWRSWLRLSNLHLAFNVLLLAILIAMPVAMLRQGIAAIGEVSPAELKRVTEIVSSINGINVETRYGGQLSEQLGKAPKTVQLLKVLSGNINDGAWLDRFSFKGDEISLRGEADSATSVSDELSRTELFSSIKFVSSIRKNPKTGKESFELLLRLKPDA